MVNYHAITCSVTTMEFQSIYSSLPTHKSSGFWAFAVKAWAWHSLGTGRVSRRGCHAPPDWLHSWASSSQPVLVTLQLSLPELHCPPKDVPLCEAWDDCPGLSFSRACVTVPCFVNQSLFLPQSSQWLKVPWITSFEVPLQSERSAVHFISCIYSLKKYWTLASCPAWGFRSQTVPAPQKLLSWNSANTENNLSQVRR